jgi:hypothetical protein
MGVGVDSLVRGAMNVRRRGVLVAAVAMLLAVHGFDLGRHGRSFLRTVYLPTQTPPAVERLVRGNLGGGARAAIDYTYQAPITRQVDDIGFFDSVILARPYAAQLDLNGDPPTLNIQDRLGSRLNLRTIQAGAARVLVTDIDRPDLKLLSGNNPVRVYEVPDPLPRAGFVPEDHVVRVTPEQLHANLRDPHHDLHTTVMLTEAVAASAGTGVHDPESVPATAPAAPVTYARPSPDVIELRVTAPSAGVVRVIESWDPGWTATVNGSPVEPLIADDVYLAVPVRAGASTIRLTFATPGRRTGLVISLIGMGLLAALVAAPMRPRRAESEQVL